MTPEINEIGGHPRRTLLFPQSSEEISPEFHNTSINLLNQSTLSCPKIESHHQNLPTLEAASFQDAIPLPTITNQDFQQKSLLNQSFPAYVQRVSSNASPDATTFSQRPSSNTSHHGNINTGSSSPLCSHPHSHISKNLQRIEREMGEAFYQMKNQRNHPPAQYLRKSMPYKTISRGNSTHSFRISPQLAGTINHQSLSKGIAFRTLPNMHYPQIPQSMPSTSPDCFSAESHSYLPSTIQSQSGMMHQHRRVISSESTGSEPVSTVLSMNERPMGQNCQSKLIEEQAEVITKLSERLTTMEHKNEEYINLLKELSFRVMGQQRGSVQSQDENANQNERSGSVLVCELIEQMNNAQGEREALNHTIVRKDENIAQLSQETQQLRKELLAVEHSSHAKEEEHLKKINEQHDELERKELIIQTIQQKACILEDTDQLLNSLLRKLEKEFEDVHFKQEVSTVIKVKQLEEFLFNQEATRERRSLGKVKKELAKVKELLTESGAQNEGEIKKLRAENKRHRNYIEIIEREVEMQKLMSSTKSLLGKEEDRIRPIGDSTQRKLMQRRASQEPSRISNLLITEQGLESSYDSILSKLGSLQDQISHMKMQQDDTERFRSERMPLDHSFIRTAEFRSEKKAMSQKRMNIVPEIDISPEHIVRPVLKDIQNKSGFNRSILLVKQKQATLKNTKPQLTKINIFNKAAPRARSMARRTTTKTQKVVNRTFCGKENMEEGKRLTKRAESKKGMKTRSKKT